MAKAGSDPRPDKMKGKKASPTVGKNKPYAAPGGVGSKKGK